MPSSLFLKIFLWFAGVVLTVIVGTFVVSEVMRPEHGDPPRRPLEPILAVQGQTAAEIFERDGSAGLGPQLDRIHHENNVRAFLFNRQLQELSGGRVPPPVADLAARVLQTNAPQWSQGGPSPLLGQTVYTNSGGEYVLVAELPPRPPPPQFFHPIFHLLAIALVGAAFCYGLAWYLTSPVAKLRKATQEFAAGNLSTRVMPSLGSRRDELASLGADFDVMAEQIESLINSQRRLLGDISHELRSPLARLSVALELARQRSGPEAESALQRIHREAENLNDMIGQLLALTRLESGTGSVTTTPFDLAQLVREIADDADFEARSRHRTVVIKGLGSHVITGNYELLRRAIENVIRNAVQYTAENTAVEVSLEMEKRADVESAVITVRDHGAGVPEASLEKIFQPFYRVDEARDRAAGGVGLGLAITERAIRLHGGSVKAANAAHGGLVVVIQLVGSERQTADSKQPTANGKQKTI